MPVDHSTLCPSAQPDWEGSRVFGVVGGSTDTPETAYLPEPQSVTDALLAMAKPVYAAEVFRFAAPCACKSCGHFNGETSQCRLAEKVVRWAPPVVDALPVCGIRADCRWWQQEGPAACVRCPQVVTMNPMASEALHKAADPTVF